VRGHQATAIWGFSTVGSLGKLRVNGRESRDLGSEDRRERGDGNSSQSYLLIKRRRNGRAFGPGDRECGRIEQFNEGGKRWIVGTFGNGSKSETTAKKTRKAFGNLGGIRYKRVGCVQ